MYKSSFSFIFVSLLMFSVLKSNAQVYKSSNPLAHTYSIVAIDTINREIGVAVQSHWFATGTLVTWAEAGVGAVATQSFVNPEFGPDGLQLMKMGFNAKESLNMLIKKDEGRDVRQLAMVDINGNVAAYTGKKCIQSAGHIEGKHYSVQANLMDNDSVWPAMGKDYEKNTTLPLAERMLSAMKAAEQAGGDIRGKQSAAVLVVSMDATGKSWVDRKVDLRVDDHTSPLEEMERLLKVHRAYEHMNNGDVAMEHGNNKLAMSEYGKAQSLLPENLEMQYWYAVTLVNTGKVEKALPVFRNVFMKGSNWYELTSRIADSGLLNVSDKELKRILSIK